MSGLREIPTPHDNRPSPDVFLSRDLESVSVLYYEYLHKADHDLHSFCLYYQSLTTASGSRLFGSVVRTLDFCPGGSRFGSLQGRVIFSYALFLFVTALMS